MVFMTFAIECTVHFLREQRTELYKQYCSGVAQIKNVLGVKNTLQSWAFLNLERCGA